MQHSRRLAIITGVMTIIIVISGFFSLSFIDDWRQRSRGFEIFIHFSNLNNLSVGAPVKLAGGKEVGFVKEISQKNLQTKVRIYLDNVLLNQLPARRETRFSIFNTSLFGQKYINIFLPTKNEDDEFIQPGDTITGLSPASVDNFLLAFSTWFDGKSGNDVMKGVGNKVEIFLTQFNEVVKENRSDVAATVAQASHVYTKFSKQADLLSLKLKAIAMNINISGQKNKSRLVGISKNIAEFRASLQQLSKSLKFGTGSLKQFMTSKEIRKNSRLTYYHGKKLVNCLNNRAFEVVFTKKSCD